LSEPGRQAKDWRGTGGTEEIRRLEEVSRNAPSTWVTKR